MLFYDKVRHQCGDGQDICKGVEILNTWEANELYPLTYIATEL